MASTLSVILQWVVGRVERNQYIQLVKVLYYKLQTNSKHLTMKQLVMFYLKLPEFIDVISVILYNITLHTPCNKNRMLVSYTYNTVFVIYSNIHLYQRKPKIDFLHQKLNQLTFYTVLFKGLYNIVCFKSWLNLAQISEFVYTDNPPK